MQFDELRTGNFAKLGEAVEDWTRLIAKLGDLRSSARDDLRAKALSADWSGVNATVTREFITKTAGEFDDAHTQASSIRNILRDTRGELVSCRDRLNAAIERGRGAGIVVQGSGGCGFAVRAGEGRDDVTEAALQALRTELQALVNEATDRDTSAAQALRALVDQSPYGFSGARYTSRDEAVEALRAAETAARLARDPQSMSAAERDRLTAVLKEHGRDPLFAERFATRLGASGTLGFWAGLDGGTAELQKQLSLTLAAATRSDSTAMRGWERDMVSLGDELVPKDTGHHLGFQVMSNLMRWGDYDDRFLTEYGSELVRTEKGRAGGSDTASAWPFDPADDGLNHTGSDTGRDPMTGFMKALSHSPDAATDFFGAKDGGRSTNFQYLFEEREWPRDHAADGSLSHTGRNAMGHALEAAMTGHPAGTGPSPETAPHNREQAALFKGLVESVAEDPKRLTDHGYLSDSVGRITAEYLPDINRSMSNDSSGDTNRLFPVTGAAAEMHDRDVTRFLLAVGQDPKGYAAVEVGQKAYMANLMDHHLNPGLAEEKRYVSDPQIIVNDIATRSGEISGVLAIGRQEAVAGPADEADKAYSDALSSVKTGISGGIGIGIGVGTTFVASPVAGAAAGGAAGTVTGVFLEEVFQEYESDAKEKAGAKIGQHWESEEDRSMRHSQRAVDLAVEAHHLPQQEDLRSSARAGTDRGFQGAGVGVSRMAADLQTDL